MSDLTDLRHQLDDLQKLADKCDENCSICNQSPNGSTTKTKSIKFAPRIQKGGNHGEDNRKQRKEVD